MNNKERTIKIFQYYINDFYNIEDFFLDQSRINEEEEIFLIKMENGYFISLFSFVKNKIFGKNDFFYYICYNGIEELKFNIDYQTFCSLKNKFINCYNSWHEKREQIEIDKILSQLKKYEKMKKIGEEQERNKNPEESIKNAYKLHNYEDAEIVSSQLNKEENQFEVIIKQPNPSFGLEGESQFRVWKNIFAVNENGEIYFKERKDGKYIPPKTIEEDYKFD